MNDGHLRVATDKEGQIGRSRNCATSGTESELLERHAQAFEDVAVVVRRLAEMRQGSHSTGEPAGHGQEGASQATSGGSNDAQVGRTEALLRQKGILVERMKEGSEDDGLVSLADLIGRKHDNVARLL